ncbi:MAG: M42 family metallopeptidase [Candidatus Krumholzibacteriota bacterium]|nr:M42 family metallopeptidase [Candidatus Krumholzibacteriota bacterium]
MDRMESLMRELVEAVGVPGYEGEVFDLMARNLEGVAAIERDRLGSLIARLEKGPERPRVMVAAHMDEIGFMVSHFTGNFIRFNTLGAWWEPRMIGLPVVVRTSRGDVRGVVSSKSPFMMEREERDKPVKTKDLFVDVGLTGKKTPESLGIRPGDPIVPWGPFTMLAGGKTYMAKAWDDRLGCAVLVESLRRLSRFRPVNAVYGVGTVQEEVGLRGAQTAAHRVDPDVCVAVDVNIASDLPGAPEGSTEKLGAGVSICVYDASLIPNTRLRDLVIAVAEKKKIPYHFSAIPLGGTDGGRVQVSRDGVPTIVLGVPTRYIHSAAGIVLRRDVDSAVRLVVETVRALDAKTVAGLA